MLSGKRSRQQVIVTGQYANSELRDLTPAAEFDQTGLLRILQSFRVTA